jgi:hypothetical protein
VSLLWHGIWGVRLLMRTDIVEPAGMVRAALDPSNQIPASGLASQPGSLGVKVTNKPSGR